MKWLQELDLIYSYAFNPTSNTDQDYELLIKQYEDGPKVGLTDVGFGVSQVLPVLVLSAITLLKAQSSSLNSLKRTCIRKHNQS